MRRARRARDRDDLKARMDAIQAEGQGVWQLSIWGPENMLGVTAAAMSGDPEATAVLRAIAHSLRAIEEAPADRPWLCLTCDHAFTAHNTPLAFVLLHACRADAKAAVSNGLCDDCYCRPGSLMERVTDVYRRNMIPGLRVLPPISQPGKA